MMIPNTMRLAFEAAVAGTRHTRRGAVWSLVKSRLRGKAGVTLRRRMWSVERVKRR